MNWSALIAAIIAVLSVLGTYLHSRNTRKQLNDHLDNPRING